jgi:hypothetical protein
MDFKLPMVAELVIEDGAGSFAAPIEMVKLLVLAVALFASVTRTVSDKFWTEVGVPLMTPVAVSRERPDPTREPETSEKL